MSDAELRDQLMTLLMAGHETTATGLAWAFDLLFRAPDKLERLRAEIAEGGHEYLDAVIEETLRVRPVVPCVGRKLSAAAELGGYELPADTVVMPAIYLAHTRPDLYPEPYAFRPERFLDGGPETYSWIPFGGGTRRCIGAAFAQLEMRVVLARCSARPSSVRPRIEPEPIVRRNVTLSPRNGTPAILVSRSAASPPQRARAARRPRAGGPGRRRGRRRRPDQCPPPPRRDPGAAGFVVSCSASRSRKLVPSSQARCADSWTIR